MGKFWEAEVENDKIMSHTGMNMFRGEAIGDVGENG